MLLVLLLLAGRLASAVAGLPPPRSAVKAAYWPSWLDVTFPVSAIDTSHFTHIYYAFLVPDPSSFELAIPDSDHLLLSRFNSQLHAQELQMRPKTLLSIGGGGANATVLASMASDPSRRLKFIMSAIRTTRQYGFDGVDLDWEYPRNPKEMADLGDLLREWRVEIVREAQTTGSKQLLFTAAVYFSVQRFMDAANQTYPTVAVTENLDWINVMCFDYRGSWDTTATGAHAALFDPNSRVSTSYGIESWVSAGVPAGKLVMGLPLFAHTWKLADPNVNGIGAPAVGVGPGKESGIMTFAEVVEFNRREKAKVVYDKSTVSAYSYSGTSWIGYDNQVSVRKKIKFARRRGLAGYFFWAVHGDKDWKISKQASKSWSS